MDGTATSSLSIYDEAALCSNSFKSVNHIINHHYIMLPSTCVGYSEDWYIRGYMKFPLVRHILLMSNCSISTGTVC